MHDLITFVETLGLSLLACVLAFWLGRVSRDGEIPARNKSGQFTKKR